MESIRGFNPSRSILVRPFWAPFRDENLEADCHLKGGTQNIPSMQHLGVSHFLDCIGVLTKHCLQVILNVRQSFFQDNFVNIYIYIYWHTYHDVYCTCFQHPSPPTLHLDPKKTVVVTLSQLNRDFLPSTSSGSPSKSHSGLGWSLVSHPSTGSQELHFQRLLVSNHWVVPKVNHWPFFKGRNITAC